MPSKPFFKSHAERIDIFVHLLDKRDCLDNWFVLSIDILSAAMARIAVTQTKLGSLNVLVSDLCCKREC